MEAYEQLERLGRGQYGAVHRVRQRATGRVLAMKRVFVGGDEGQVHRPRTPPPGPGHAPCPPRPSRRHRQPPPSPSGPPHPRG